MDTNPQDDSVVSLTSLPTEPMAAMLLARLREEGIDCQMAGGLTAAFRAEAPGGA
jgi:hypothetical protein